MQSGQNQISPCNNKCIMNPATHYCTGCFRTIEEIIQWTHYSMEEKTKVMQQTEIRKSSSRKNEFQS